MFAVVESGGKQYRVKSGDVIKTEKIDLSSGSEFFFDKVIAIAGKFGAGASAAKVNAVILEHKKNDKEIIFKKKRRHNYRRKRGHRQEITVVKIMNVAE